MKHRNLKYYRALLYLSIVVLIFILLWVYSYMYLFPRGQKEFEDQIYKKVQLIVNEEFTNKNKDIVHIEKDYNGNIIAVKSDNNKLTKLSYELGKNLKGLLITGENDPYIPMKATIFYPLKYKMHLGGARVMDLQTSYNSKFIHEGSNNTHLIISVNVNITYEYLLGDGNWQHDFIIWDGILKGLVQKN